MYKTTSRQKRIDQAKSDLTTNLENGSNVLSKGNINVLATVIGATAFELEQYIKYVADQAMLLTAEDQYLESVHGKLWNVPRNEAIKFEGNVEFTGINGAIIPINTELQSAAGNLYLTTVEAIIENSKAIVSIQSLEYGSVSNLNVNSELSLTEAIDNLESSAILKNIKVPGQNQEAKDDYRLRIQQHINNRNNTGTLADYELWAKQVTGIKQAYARRNINGAGTVGLYIVSNDNLTAAVEDHIASLKPVSAEVFVIKPEAQTVDLNVSIKPYSESIKQKVANSLNTYFNSLEFEESIIATQLNKTISDNPEIEDYQTNATNIKVNVGSTAVLGNLIIQELVNG